MFYKLWAEYRGLDSNETNIIFISKDAAKKWVWQELIEDYNGKDNLSFHTGYETVEDIFDRGDAGFTELTLIEWLIKPLFFKGLIGADFSRPKRVCQEQIK